MTLRLCQILFVVLVWGVAALWAQDDAASAEAALARVEQARQENLEGRPRFEEPQVASQGVRLRRRSLRGTEIDPIYRNGVPYFDNWTIRAGAQLLRVPAYLGWQSVRPESEFYAMQAGLGEKGNHLAAVLTNGAFVRESRSKYVNYFALIWVPQEHAFKEMGSASFEVFKEGLHERLVSEREKTVEREDFSSFENYLDFKSGNDFEVSEYVDGYLVKSIDEDNIVTYYATSEFVYQTRKTEIRQPMIMTVTYALVEGKLLKVDFKRLFTKDEDATQLLVFTRRFIDDMRVVNGLGERRLR